MAFKKCHKIIFKKCHIHVFMMPALTWSHENKRKIWNFYRKFWTILACLLRSRLGILLDLLIANFVNVFKYCVFCRCQKKRSTVCKKEAQKVWGKPKVPELCQAAKDQTEQWVTRGERTNHLPKCKTSACRRGLSSPRWEYQQKQNAAGEAKWWNKKQWEPMLML